MMSKSVNCCVRQPEKRPKCRSWGKAKHGVGTSGRDQTRTTKIGKRLGKKTKRKNYVR